MNGSRMVRGLLLATAVVVAVFAALFAHHRGEMPHPVMKKSRGTFGLIAFAAVSVAVVAVVSAYVTLSLTGALSDGAAEPKAAVVATEAPAPSPVPPTATVEPTPEPTIPPTPAPEIPIARLVIPSINVNAEVNTRGVNADGSMEDPRGPREVAWYNFSALPGRIGNVVMAGHVDYVNYGAAVFYNLRKLKEGDEVEVRLTNGESVRYTVTSVELYHADTAPVAEIVGPTDVETVTLITCGGTFDRSVREYDQRVVVRAVRAV